MVVYEFENAAKSVAKAAQFEITQDGKSPFIHFSLGETLAPDTDLPGVPDWIQQTDTKPLGDTLSVTINTMIGNQAVVDVIEELEPGAHSFREVRVRRKDGVEVETPYFLVSPGQIFCASLVDEEGSANWRTENRLGPVVPNATQSGYRPVLSLPRIAGRHLWRSEVVDGGKTFVSETLYKAFKKRVATNWKFLRADVVDRPWIAEDNLGPFLEWRKTVPPETPGRDLHEW